MASVLPDPAAPVRPGRRALLRGGALTGAAVVTVAAMPAGPVEAAEPLPRPYAGKPLLPAAERHLVTRFSYGVTPELATQVRRAGGAAAWFEHQLSPGRIRDAKADRLARWWPSLRRTPQDLWRRQIDEVEGGWEVMGDYARWCLLRRITSKRQVLEVMTEFWENHLHVPAVGDAQFTHRVDYGTTIRKHALGRFDELLVATITHPAMLIYLSAVDSTKRHPNENLGRELLELHTVGVGHYSEKDVRDSARILTGWSVDQWKSWRPTYFHDDHYRGKVKVRGFKDKNKDADGRDLTRRYLAYLAHHPDTAERIARRLAVKFVSDDPPKALVKRLAKVYLAHDTEIKPVLRALVASKSFRKAAGKKVRDPGEDVCASYRALGVKVRRPVGADYQEGSAAAAILWQAGSVGLEPFAWGRPDGQPIDNASWSSPSRLLGSMSLHLNLSGGWWPSKEVHYRSPKAWMPAREIRFDELVDHVSQIVLHQHASARLLTACCEATGIGRHEPITEEHELIDWMFPRFLTTFLDSPAHLSR